jgi:hypothetical protein
MRFRYIVIEEGATNQEKYLEIGKRTSEEIDSFLMEGTTKGLLIKDIDKVKRFALYLYVSQNHCHIPYWFIKK